MLGGVTGRVSYPAHVRMLHRILTRGISTNDGNIDPSPADTIPANSQVEGIVNLIRDRELIDEEDEDGNILHVFDEYGDHSQKHPDDPMDYMGVTGVKTIQAIVDFSDAIGGINTDINWVTAFADSLGSGISTIITEASADGILEATASLAAANIAAAAIAEDTPISDVVASHEVNIDVRQLRGVNRYTGGQAFGGLGSGQFVMGMALIESEGIKDISRLEADLKHEAYQSALNIYTQTRSEIMDSIIQSGIGVAAQGADTMVRVLLAKVGLEGDLASAWMRSNVYLTQARVDYTERNLEIVREQALWPLKLYQFAVPYQSPGSGVGQSSGQMTRGQSALSGAFVGASAGAKGGGWVGAGIGAVLGGVMGWQQ